MTGLLISLSIGLALAIGIPVVRYFYGMSVHANPAVYLLTFPTDLEAEAVERLMAAISGLLPPVWIRWVTRPVLSFEVHADSSGIRHYLIVPRSSSRTIEAALTAHVPSVRYTRTQRPAVTMRLAAEYRISSQQRPLRLDSTGLNSGLLSSLQPLAESTVVVQWLLTPAGPVLPAQLARDSHTAVWLPNGYAEVSTSEALTAIRKKLDSPLLLAVARIGTCGPTRSVSQTLLRHVEAPWHASRAPGVHLQRRLLPGRSVARRINHCSLPLLRFPMVLNTAEVTGLIGWPVGLSHVPGLALGGCRLLPVPQAVPTLGTLLGTSTFPGSKGRPVALDLEARKVHVAVTGPTGAGKTTLLTQIVLSDIESGYGVVVMDPKGGELTDQVLERMPASRIKDLILLDASDDERPVGYNPLACTPNSRELVCENVLGVMRSIWKDSWGPRSDEIIRAALLSLTAVDGMTLTELSALLVDGHFRNRLLRQIHDPFGVEGFWATYGAWSEPERITNTAPVLNKARALTMRSRLRGILGQAQGAIDFKRIIERQQILLVNLAPGTLGTSASYLLGALLFSGLWDAVSARAGLRASQRPPVMATLDEFQHVVALPTPAETVLAEARSYGLGLCLAHQHRGQLPRELADAVSANARTRVVFQTNRKDAATFAKELGGSLTPNDLMGIPAFEAVASCFAAGSSQPAATIATLPLPKPVRSARELYEVSRANWGVDRAEVEQAIADRQQGHEHEGTPVGRRRRSQG